LDDVLKLDENEKAWVALFRAFRALDRAREVELERFGLSTIEAAVLHALKTADEPTTNPFSINSGYVIFSRDPHTGTYAAELYSNVGGGSGRVRIAAPAMVGINHIIVEAWIYVDYHNGYIQFIRTAGHVEGYYT